MIPIYLVMNPDMIPAMYFTTIWEDGCFYTPFMVSPEMATVIINYLNIIAVGDYKLYPMLLNAVQMILDFKLQLSDVTEAEIEELTNYRELSAYLAQGRKDIPKKLKRPYELAKGMKI